MNMHHSVMLKFLPHNFTPPQRTPWGGRKILEHFKRALPCPHTLEPGPVGESWEFSLDPQFPSTCEQPHGALFSDILLQDHSWLSPGHIKRWGANSPLLLKIIDAASTLSVQVHPDFNDPKLGPNESGKWEAWYILHVEPGAGIYCGLKPGVKESELLEAVQHNEAVQDYLHFHKVCAGQSYVIKPGFVHAIGAGVCVLEPQVSLPNRQAVTYRLWDWNRKFDDLGQLSQSGKARSLHTQRALQCIDFSQPPLTAQPAQRLHAPYPSSLQAQQIIASEHLQCLLFEGSANTHIPLPGELCSLCVLSGSLQICAQQQTLHFQQGQSGALSAMLSDIHLHCEQAKFTLTWAGPGINNS